MYQSQKRRRIKPFARPTSFDINVVYDIRHYQAIKYGNVIDPYFPALGTDEAFHVLEGEVLMQTLSPGVRRYGDHQMHVFSFANGLQANKVVLNASYGQITLEDGTKEDILPPAKASILDGLKYAGVAVTEFSPEKDIFEQGFVMTMAGLNTIFNNGKDIIYPGDVICADIPTPSKKGAARKNRALQTGIPREKLQFIVTPFNILADELGRGEATDKSRALASRFVMGTALSYSRPGSSLDVVLHKCNMIVVKRPPVQPPVGENQAVPADEIPGGNSLVPKKTGKKKK